MARKARRRALPDDDLIQRAKRVRFSSREAIIDSHRIREDCHALEVKTRSKYSLTVGSVATLPALRHA